jgi:predicted transcriptional regulator
MGRPKVAELTERELEVMHVFWQGGEELAVADVQQRMEEGGRSLAYTTVATLIRILLDKGYLRQTTDVRPHRFQAKRSFQDVSGRLVRDLIQRVFGGSREALLVRLMDDQQLSGAERQAVEKLLQRTRGKHS